MVIIAYGFFMGGYHWYKRAALKRLAKFVGQPLNFEILFYVINGKKL